MQKKTKTSKTKPSIVYLVGSGPGDPGLLTLRGKECLEKAQVVFYDHLVHPELLRFCPQARLYDVGKTGHGFHVSQKKIESLLLGAARKYRVVVRLKGGDPFIFGRGGEEAEALQKAKVPFEIVPGVTSAIAVPAYAGIPLTHRDFASCVTFVTGHEDPKKEKNKNKRPPLDWEALARERTLVFLMGVKTLTYNFEKLLQHGMSPRTPAALIEWGTYPRQRTVVGTLQTLPKRARLAKIGAPAVTVVGEVVGLRGKLRWFESKPLLGKKILVCRASQQAGAMSRPLGDLGAESIEFSTLEIVPPLSWRDVDRAVGELKNYAFVIFTSVHAVNFFFERLRQLGKDLRSLGTAKLVAVGPATADRLRDLGLRVDHVPSLFTSKELGKTLKTSLIRGKKILFPRAQEAREEIVKDLRSRGAELRVVTVYRTKAPRISAEKIRQVFGERLPDLLTFSSGAMVRNFAEILRKTPYWKRVRKIPALVIGPVTREATKQAGLRVVGMPKRYTVPDLIKSILKYFQE